MDKRLAGLRFRRLGCRPAALVVGLGILGSAVAQTTAPVVTGFSAATWNLGWHLSQAESAEWARRCGQTFARNPETRQWAPARQGDKTGWQLNWGRNAPIQWPIGEWPPCDVYQDRFKPIAVTPEAYSVRLRQIRELLADRVKADILAFQEVSGEAAVREVLPDGGRGWEVCSFRGYKVQRLAIAWRQSLARRVSCDVFAPLALPSRPAAQQPRPGLALTLEMPTPQGPKRLRVMTLHLKSSCVSPLEAASPKQPERGRLDGTDEHCLVLQDQVAPLEAWIEAAGAGVDGVLMLGDFNRNLAHESREAAHLPVRQRGNATDPHGAQTRVRNLWRDANDGQPPASMLRLLDTACDDTASATLCQAAKSRPLDEDEQKGLRHAQSGLGCRNPIGLDHIAIGGALNADGGARKVAIGLYGRSRAADDKRPEPLLAVSDHCPLAADLRWR